MTVSTPDEYVAAVPADRRSAIETVRRAVRSSLPAGYEEGIQFGMISWFVPLSTYPTGYGENPRQPLPLLSLAAQKNHFSLHMLCLYAQPELSEWFGAEYEKSGKKLDMGKGCVRFKTIEDLAIDVVKRTVARISVAQHVAAYEARRGSAGKKSGSNRASKAKSASKQKSRSASDPQAKGKRATLVARGARRRP